MLSEPLTAPLTASQRARQINNATRAWIAESPTDRGVLLLVEDEIHWTEYGISTGDELDHYLAVQDYVESYRDIHGIRPRWMRFDQMSLEQIKMETTILFAAEASREENRTPAPKEISDGPLKHNPFASLSISK